MDYNEFYEWLIKEKGLTNRSAKDVISRCKRVCLKLLNIDRISNDTLKNLNTNKAFVECSMFIKSQLRRAVCLYNEFDCKKK